MIQNYIHQYAGIWERCSSKMPEFSKTYLKTGKIKKEQILDQFLSSIKTFRKEHRNIKSITDADQQGLLLKARSFLCNGLDFTDAQQEMMFSDEMIEVTKTFVRQARTFDPNLSFNDIFQACRNMWIMNGLQLIMGIPIKVTPSVFAYSMLYPYTDNLIDNPQISGVEKLIFSERFRSRLSGVVLIPKNKTEEAIFHLVGMIESEYSRTDFPEVFESLLGIHDAQTSSLKLIQEKDTIPEKEILKICLAKGGASVIADGYLVAGKLTEKQQFFLFGYGAYLQLLDDLQDVDEDYAAGLMTVFSKYAFQFPLDEKLSKIYWFGEEVMKSLDSFNGRHIDVFKSLMRRSMDLFITVSVAQNPDVFSGQFVSELENFSLFRFSYISKRKEKFASDHGFLFTVFEEISFA